jgi:hypothetical protein
VLKTITDSVKSKPITKTSSSKVSFERFSDCRVSGKPKVTVWIMKSQTDRSSNVMFIIKVINSKVTSVPLLQLEQLVSDMSSIYSKAKICDYKNPNKCDLSLEPGILHSFRCNRAVTEK